MIEIFEFEDSVSYINGSHVEKININNELAELQEKGYKIIDVKLNILPNYQQGWTRFNKRIYMVIVES